jgi:hypothetical protein
MVFRYVRKGGQIVYPVPNLAASCSRKNDALYCAKFPGSSVK